MKSYFRHLRVLQVVAILNLTLFLSVLLLIALFYGFWYQSLPENSPIRSRLQLGAIISKFEPGWLFSDLRSLNIPIYDLEIKQVKLQKMLEELPPSDALMTDEYRKFESAKFSFAGQSYKVKTRIRGLTPNHWQDEKKSWRIKFNSDALFNHTKSLNLIIPQDRGFFAEYLSNSIARKLNLLTPRDTFVFLRLNGVLQGVYYSIETPSKVFLEYNRKVDDANFYREDNWDWFKYGFDPIFTDIGHWKKDNSETYSGFENYADIDYLLTLLNSSTDETFNKEIPALIDMDVFLRWQAHSMIMGSYHQSEHGNNNLFFNPITGKFEFMPYDLNIFPLEGQFIDKPYNPLVTRILENRRFLHERNTILWDYVNNPTDLENDLKFYDDAYQKYKKAFYADRKKGFTNSSFDNTVSRLRRIFIQNHKKIIANLEFCEIFATVHIHPKSNKILGSLDLALHGFSSAKLSEIIIPFSADSTITQGTKVNIYYDSNASEYFDAEDTFLTSLTADAQKKCFKGDSFSLMLYSARDAQLQPVKAHYKFFITGNANEAMQQSLGAINIVASNAVTKKQLTPIVRCVDGRLFSSFPQVTASLDAFLLEYPQFKQDANSSFTVVLDAGEYIIDRTIIVPSGLTLIINPGVVLKFQKSISFLSYAKVVAIGNKEHPIRFTALDKIEPWGNFAVIGESSASSEFSYCIIEYSGESYVNGIKFSGGISVHDSDVIVRNCILRYSFGDDAINIKSAHCILENSVFYKNSSDAIDFDFATGAIENNYILDNTGDGIDLCGTDIVIAGNRIESSGDKGISVGERSKPVIVNNLIRSCNIGIASKDKSDARIVNSTLVDNKTGISLYMKKQVFGPAAVEIRNTVLWNNEKEIIADAGSVIAISESTLSLGAEGTYISNFTPLFVDIKNGNYLLTDSRKDSTGKIPKSNITYLKDMPQFKDLKDANIGILTNPEVMSFDDFSVP
ncbi:MAG: hypothetical protein A2Y00_03140 [Omnitrophica WOR_2 bacterium GWF2_43_52]|nr:MAG: hypothetical protein A2Y00_03140 [Omnitrophica WOR_2 bacterium GWF2_43_52]OGX57636.1 MAG: hypothetical protein A2460_02650 [Omnitrophica WOR_2 bacterium RIFOXYC2_FULL_43_9]HAH20848.1 hypothetical protein [Candidatus Omnitrophota bacterium]HBG64516.1 hypothetical protein [Candidatus Omnitrophota bacterium]